MEINQGSGYQSVREITHYDTIMDFDIAREAHCDITMDNGVTRVTLCVVTMSNGIAMCTHHGITLSNDVAIKLYIYYALLCLFSLFYLG